MEAVILRDGSSALLREVRLASSEALLGEVLPALLANTPAASTATGEAVRVFAVTRDALPPNALPAETPPPAADLPTDDAASTEVALGGATYRPASDGEPPTATVAVDAAHTGLGIATLLLERIAEVARHDEADRFTVEVPASDEAALAVLHESGLLLAEAPAPGDASHAGTIVVTLATAADARGAERVDERSRAATAASLAPIFRPRSVAVVGASRRPGSIGRTVLERLIGSGFAGPLYPVNPSAPDIAGVTAYPTVTAIPGPVDLAVIAVPAHAVTATVEACAAHGVRGLVVLTAGFAEVGEAGRTHQQELLRLVRGHGMRMIGPNCIGVFNTHPDVRLNATFGRELPGAGHVAMSSQSGAMGLAITDYARQLGLGLSSFVSVGNKADVSSNDLLEYWESDPATNVIALYMESFGNPRRFSRIARRVARTKPIVAVKSGRSAAGSRAAASHTAALASSDVAADALFEQSGIVRVDTLEELFAVASVLTNQPLPAGNRVAIITNAGGPGILAADACAAAGLELPPLGDETLEVLRALLPPTAGLNNPIDMIAAATPEQYELVAQQVLLDPAVDALIAINISVGGDPAEAFGSAIRRGAEHAALAGAHKPLLACFMSPGEPPPALRIAATDAVDAGGVGTIPAFRFPEAAARALGRAWEHARWRARPPGRVTPPDGVDAHAARAVAAAAANGSAGADGWLDADQTRALLASAGITLPRALRATTPQQAESLATTIGGPVAVKVISEQILHKTDVGGVALDLPDGATARAACEEMQRRIDAPIEGFLVQEMVPPGQEVLVGVVHDPTFGPLVGFGLGGTAVEVLRDTAFRLSPLTDRDAGDMIRAIRGFPLLAGYRGAAPCDLPALEDLLLRVSWLVETVPLIAEMDLNPVRLFAEGRGLAVVDTRVRVAQTP